MKRVGSHLLVTAMLFGLAPEMGAQPAVEITLLTPNSGTFGDSVTISGSGFAQFFEENLVTFNGKHAPVIAGGPDSLTVTVPAGATTGLVQVRVGKLISNTLPFTVFPAGGFVRLSGIGTNPANFHIFVTDTSATPVSSTLIELEPFNNWARTPRGGIANIRGFPLSPDNRLFFGNASRSNFNQGIISFWNLDTMTQGNWPRSAGAAGNPVAAVALGFSPTNTQAEKFVFYADRRNNHIRRVGNLLLQVYAGGFDFPNSDYDPLNVAGFGGLAFDSNGVPDTTNFGDLYVSSGSSIVRVRQSRPLEEPDETTQTIVVSGLGSPAGLYFDDTRTLHIAEFGGNRIGLYHAPTENFEARLSSPLTSPRMATLGRTNDTPPESRLYIAEQTRVVAADDQRVSMAPSENIQALISNCPLPAQTPGCAGVPYPSSFQTRPREIEITARIHPPRTGVTIHFDLEDPPDTAPYGNRAPGDNAGGPGTVSPLSAVTDAEGKATTVLTITDRYAGDNYRVRARLAADGPIVAKTGIITAWKRVFVEMDRMFRQPGQYLTQSAVAGEVTLSVADSGRFSAGDIVLIFDASNQAADARTVASTTPTTITLTSPIARNYDTLDFAYVGRSADGFYEPDMSELYRPFDQAFAEWMFVFDGSDVIPYEDATGAFFSSADGIRSFSRTWFQNGRTLFDLTNYIHLIGARDDFVAGRVGVSNIGLNFSIAYIQRIEDLFGGSAANAIRAIGAHELGHQFHLNLDTDPDGGHDSNSAWCAGPGGLCDLELCVMNVSTNFTDDRVEFCIPNLNGSPNNGVRTVSDPR